MPTIDTDRLRLRPFVLGDVDAYHQAITADPDVMRYLPGGVPRPRERAADMLRRFMGHWAQHGMGLWAVEHEGALIGHCGLQMVPDTTQVEVAYALARGISA
jgi:RimJ/RimL family protein N-acetyltransferase